MPFLGQFTVGRIFGLPIKLDMSWFIIFALVAWSLAVGVFPFEYPTLSPVTFWLMGLVSAFFLFVSVLVHELMHCVAARQHGIPIRGITLFIFGGVSEMGQEPPNPRAEFVMAAAGPLTSILLCILLGAGAWALWTMGASQALYGVIKYLAFINAALAIFNLIPGFPLDGGRLLRALLWMMTDDLRKATRVASTVGSAFGLGLILLGFIQIMVNPHLWLGGLWLALIGFFLRTAAQGSYRQLLLRRALQGISVGQVMSTNVVTVSPDLLVSDLVHDYFMRHRFHSFPVLDGDQLVGLVTLHEVKQVPRAQWEKVTVREVMNKRVITLDISPHDNAMTAWILMAAQGVGRVPVVEDGRLVGIISQYDLVRFLNFASDLSPERR
jgi:Zn-dependent protease/CBS domain-containing protein